MDDVLKALANALEAHPGVLGPRYDGTADLLAALERPSTNSQHTSVGTTAIRGFLRPLAWQNAPPDLLPPS
jgi:hypothetical protein